MGIFIDPFDLPDGSDGDVQLLFLLFAYGYILYIGSNLISDGSELLLLIPELKYIVGSAILPVIGAVPDGAIVYFSADGANPQEEIAVGVGALAGSTIMLLTIPMLLAAYYGRVTISHNKPIYANPFKKILANWPEPDDHVELMKLARKFDSLPRGSISNGGNWPAFSLKVATSTREIVETQAKAWKKLDGNLSFMQTGLAVSSTVRSNFKIMVFTAITYALVQFGAYRAAGFEKADRPGVERMYAEAGCVVSILLFFWYLYLQYSNSTKLRKFILDKRIKAIEQGDVRLTDLFVELVKNSDKSEIGSKELYQDFCDHIKPFFKRFDKNKDGTLDESEIAVLLNELGEINMDVHSFFQEFDRDSDGTICEKEFCLAMFDYINRKEAECAVARKQISSPRTSEKKTPQSSVAERERQRDRETDLEKAQMHEWVETYNDEHAATATKDNEDHEDDEDEDDEEEMPEDLIKLTDEQKRRALLQRSCFMMGGGLALILLFSDPMCDVFSAIGDRVGISSFYIAFVLAPIASNASEMIASMAYAAKKTRVTTEASLSALAGAGIMNNTFCTTIFLYLIINKNLQWEYSAETTGIIFVEVMAALVLSTRSVMRLHEAFLIFLLYPLSIALIWGLENKLGWQ